MFIKKINKIMLAILIAMVPGIVFSGKQTKNKTLLDELAQDNRPLTRSQLKNVTKEVKELKESSDEGKLGEITVKNKLKKTIESAWLNPLNGKFYKKKPKNGEAFKVFVGHCKMNFTTREKDDDGNVVIDVKKVCFTGNNYE